MLMSGGQVIKKNTVLVWLIKFQLVLMIIYEGWYLQKFTAISGLLQLLAVTIIGTTLLLMWNMTLRGNKSIIYWGIFGVYSLISAFIINADMTVVLDSIFTYFAFIAVVFCAGVVSRYTSDYSWFSKAILFVAVISAFCALFYGVLYKNGDYYVTTMSDRNNPNTLGLVMGIGTFMAVFPERPPRLLGWLIRIALLFVFLLVTVNTGSRSSLICELAVIAMFVYSKLKNAKGSLVDRIVRNTAIVLTVFISATVVISFFVSGNTTSSAVQRLVENFNSESFSGRTDLYDIAWEMYRENPISGIGYNCFASMSGHGYFTHSTYMELLACTGTIGFALFLWPVLTGTWRGVRAFKRDGGRSATILLMMLVSGFFGIVYYNMVFLMVLYIEILRIPKANI